MNEMHRTIELLANKLGIATEQLIGFYVTRAYAEWADVVILLIVVVMLLTASLRFKQWGKQKVHDTQDEDYYIPAVICSVITGMFTLVMLAETSSAIKAVLAPQAYAVNAILHAL